MFAAGVVTRGVIGCIIQHDPRITWRQCELEKLGYTKRLAAPLDSLELLQALAEGVRDHLIARFREKCSH